MKRKCKNMIFIASMLLVIALGAFVSAAYSFFTMSSEATNSLTLGNNEIAFNEPNWDPEDADKIIPGKTILKDPTVKSVEGKNYVRLVVEFCENDSNSTPITNVQRIEKIKEIMYYDSSYNKNNNPITTNIKSGSTYSKSELNTMVSNNLITKIYNKNAFKLDEARSTNNKLIFNYNNILNQNEEKVLFTNLVIPAEFTSEDLELLGNFKINIHAEGIQSANTGSMEEAFKALDEGGDSGE